MSEPLQFEKAEFSEPPATVCAACGARLGGHYFHAAGKVLCDSCAGRMRALGAGANNPARLTMAALLGLGAALLGAAVYGGVMIFAHLEAAIISIGIGYFVGRAVRKGSGGLGGPVCQALAAFLTYSSIAAAYAWRELDFLSDKLADAPASTVLAVAKDAYLLPFAGGAGNILGIAIIAFGVWEAWRINRCGALEITGPHTLSAGA